VFASWTAVNRASEDELASAGFDVTKADYSFFSMIKVLNGSGVAKKCTVGWKTPW